MALKSMSMSSWCAVAEADAPRSYLLSSGCVRGLWRVTDLDQRTRWCPSPDRRWHVLCRTMLSSSSASAIRLLARTSARTTLRAPVSRRLANLSAVRNVRPRFAGTGKLAFGTVLLASFTLATTCIYADAQAESSDVVSTYYTINGVGLFNGSCAVVDPNTSITFPKTMHIPSRVPIPDLSLIGVGVRTVSFLRIKVYSVAFYADLNNPALQVCTCSSSQFAPP